MKTLTGLSMVAALLVAATALAQPVVKSTMPDGKVVYSEKPVPGAARVEKLDPPPPKAGISSLTPDEKARAEESVKERARQAQNAAADAKGGGVQEARKALQQAEAAREAGKEPQPNERIGIAGGGTRLTEAYFARQKQLEEAVAAAKKRLAAAEGSR